MEKQTMAGYLIVFILLSAASLCAQQGKPVTPWDAMQYFAGRWEGTGTGQRGASTVKLQYGKVLKDRFLRGTIVSTFARGKNDVGSREHEQWNMFSYDNTRGKVLLRQFHQEGLVVTATLETIAADGKAFVFVSESIENMPEGWRIRETYRILGKDEFTEITERAQPGGEFDRYSETRLKRK